MIKFVEKGHRYESIEGEPINWKSVTQVTKTIQEPFDAEVMAEKSSKNRKSKWYKMSKEEILQCWKYTSDISIELGNWYHKDREKQLCSINSVEIEGINCSVSVPNIIGGEKLAPNQVLDDNWVYPEHMVYLKSEGICGQSDLVEVVNGRVNIIDYKSNKEMTTSGYKSWDGKTKKLRFPCDHLDDCKLNVYNIQLSLYMYIILKHNPHLKPGKLVIQHVLFKEVGKDPLGNPINARDGNDEPIVEDVVIYELPYLKKEVMNILKNIKK